MDIKYVCVCVLIALLCMIWVQVLSFNDFSAAKLAVSVQMKWDFCGSLPSLFHFAVECSALHFVFLMVRWGGSVAEWLACWTQAQRAQVQIAAATLSGNSLRQTVHTYRASVHQTAKFVAALLRVAGVTAGLVKSNGSLPPGLWLTPPACWLQRTGISSGTLRSVIEYGLPFMVLEFQRFHKARSY